MTNAVKNSDKENYAYSGYGKAFDGKWSFENYYHRNVIIFAVKSSSSSHDNNLKNKFLILSEGDTFGINGSISSPEKKFGINISKANTRFCLSLHYNVGNSYLLVNGKELFKFKADTRNVNFPTQFCLGSIPNGFSAHEPREVFLNRNIYNFSVNYNSIDKFGILNIHKYLMTKNNIK